MQQVQQLAPNLTLSAATSVNPWVGSDGNPMTDVSAYASALNWIGGYLSLQSPSPAYPSSRDYEL